MPQMMPMLWSIMFMFLILITSMTISFIFFLNMPFCNSSSTLKTNSSFSQWSWMW